MKVKLKASTSRLLLGGFFLLTLIFSCKKDRIEIDTTDEFKTYLEDQMEDQHIPALAVLIFNEDEILHESYLGKANLQSGLALEADHLFLLASISKTVTATALLQLYDQGQFGLDDPINDYLSFSVNIPNYNTPVTFRMLLTHTSAIADGPALDGQYYNNMDSPIALDSFLSNYLVPGGDHYDAIQNFYDFEPGTEHEYSNEGNALIAVLVEQISGQDFNSYCKQNIFTPLGMTNTFWRLDEISQTMVTPYDYLSGSNQDYEPYTFTDYPNGGLRSTTRDMYLFFSAFARNGLVNNYQLLSSSTINQMLSPQIPDIDPEVGLHMFLMDRDENLWGHDGGEKGVATIMAFNQQTKVGVLLFTNQGEANLDRMLVEAYQFGEKL